MLNQAVDIIIALLPKDKTVFTTKDIEDKVDEARTLTLVRELDRELLIRHVKAQVSVFSEKHKILDAREGYVPWLKDKKAEITWNFWKRYRTYLKTDKYIAPEVINRLDNLTDDILDRLVDPSNDTSWDKRGMVVGQVQSGKTSNYTGLICKAADAGFRLIVILAGIHDSLRSQTQLRIDEGFLGFDSLNPRARTQSRGIGVGKYGQLLAYSLTSSDSEDTKGDFNRRVAETLNIPINGRDPVVLVIKKNSSILRNLIEWLAVRGETTEDGKKLITDVPFLLIDDEADNASINVSKKGVSMINGLIRALLSLFAKSAYIGYTATPFANIFIRLLDEETQKGLDTRIKDHDYKVGQDLFPKDFIINIPAPSNYIGPARVFGLEAEITDKAVVPLPIVIPIIDKDYEAVIPDSHKKDDELPYHLPPSLDKAIRCFILTCAVRRARGQVNVHNSMLIHVSRFIRWQDRIATLVDDTLKSYQGQLETGITNPEKNLKDELKVLFETEYVSVTREIISSTEEDLDIKEHTWEEIEPHLYPASAKIEVRAVHGDKKVEGLNHKNIAALDYFTHNTKGISVIAVGGDKLSRGLTLEGLSVSYYLRASKMYDTLMQMGRWFGYRPGYVDLCRLFTSKELEDWYKHITLASEEVRLEFDYMCMLNKTPKDYGLKVRTHPGGLQITAANKFRYRELMQLSYSGQLLETYSIRKDKNLLKSNYNFTRNFIASLGGTSSPLREGGKQQYIWTGVSADRIIEFVKSYITDQVNIDSRKVGDYISEQLPQALTDWTVVLINNTRPKVTHAFSIGEQEVSVGLTERSDIGTGEYYMIAKNHIISPEHEYTDLTAAELSEAFQKTKQDWKEAEKKGEPQHPGGHRIREARGSSRGLLLIYPLDYSGFRSMGVDFPVMGYAISFPEVEGDRKVEYAVNEQFKKSFDYPDELDIDENAG